MKNRFTTRISSEKLMARLRKAFNISISIESFEEKSSMLGGIQR